MLPFDRSKIRRQAFPEGEKTVVKEEIIVW